MNYVVKSSVLLFVCAAMLAPASLFSQEWSAQQNDVWKNVETYWGLAAKADLEAFLTYFHEDFSGWINGTPVPHNRTTREKFIRFNNPRSKILFQDLQPLAIKIHGNVAIAHYTYTEITKSGEEKEKTEQGRWTDILMKQGDKWIMIGDSGGTLGN
jgi:ketosteroid isomerase-like protein